MSGAPDFDAFWSWWAGVHARVEAAIGGEGFSDDLVAELSGHVRALDDGLSWELSPGLQAEHALVVSPGGNPDLRALAERWRRSAPAADTTWEFQAARLPAPSSLGETFTFGGRDVDLRELVIALEVDEERGQVDVAVHHPVFPGADDALRGQLTFLALDWLLGEEEVERWIRSVEVAEDRPPGAGPPAHLLEAVQGLREADLGDWVLLSSEDDRGRPVLVSAARALKPVDHPLLDTRVELTATYAGRGDGLPAPHELDQLRALEDDLLVQAGDAAFFAAHRSHGGERTFTLYADATTGDAERLAAWGAARGLRTDVVHDAAWDGVRAYR